MSQFAFFRSWRDAEHFVCDELSVGSVSHMTVDVFDTLLLRTTSPETVTNAVCQFVADKTGLSVPDVIGARHRAWGIETRKRVEADYDEDCDATDYLSTWLSELRLTRSSIDLTAREVLAYELSVESLFLRPNSDMRRVLVKARNLGIPVVAISDMYLSSADVSSLLQSHGFGDLIGTVYTSGENGYQKRTGRLFDHLLKKGTLFQEGVSVSNVLHIGDDLKADGQMPQSRGIRSIVVKDKHRMSFRHKARVWGSDRATAAALHALDNGKKAFQSTAFKVGFSRFGPLYAGFIHALAEKVSEDDLDSVWFLAREGWLLREIYEQLRNSGLSVRLPPSGYLYVSRVATMRAQLEEFGEAEIASTSSDVWHKTYESILSPLNIDASVLVTILARYQLAPDDLVDPIRLSQVAAAPQLREIISHIGKTERQGLAAYLRRTGFPDEGMAGIVDVGWGGQIQENLSRAVAKIGFKTSIRGYYLGTDERAEIRRKTGLAMEALVVDKLRTSGAGLGAFEFIQGIELATRAPHGSVKGYGLDGDPVLASVEGHGRKIEAQDDPAIAQLQQGILDFVVRYFEAANFLSVSAGESVSLARRMTDLISLMPTKKEALIFTQMANVANLGRDEKISLGGDASLLRPRQLKRLLSTTLWQEGSCALALPFFGPLALLIYKRWKGLLAKPQDYVALPTSLEKAGSRLPSAVTLDVLSLDLNQVRQKLISESASSSVCRDAGAFMSVRDCLALMGARGVRSMNIKSEVVSVLKALLSDCGACLESVRYAMPLNVFYKVERKLRALIVRG